MCSEIDDLFKTITSEVFYIVFNNRRLLLNFSIIVSDYISILTFDQLSDDFVENLVFLKQPGQLKSENIPVWVKNAIYFRDRGKCCLCKKDLSGILSLSDELEYDHIVPLKQGGMNDISNIQLLCKKCNRIKGDKKILTSELYEKWY